MNGNNNRSEEISKKKDQIRTRYKGVDPNELEIIPAIEQENFYEDTRKKRVAVYARVSTDDPRQTSSYELQKNHYMDLVRHHPNWNLVDIYADEGISGTSLQHRNAFIRMINDCHDGKIDLIVTKSVARFARNVLDCISHVRQLAALQPPIGILFETENIYTLNRNSEMSLSIISTLAQEESHNKSEIMNASIEMRFKRGIFLTPPLLGYDNDEDGNLIVNEEEAKTVRLVFFMYLYGYSSNKIAETLTELGRKTKKNNTIWSPNSVIQILQNERHCGDVLARKTWTPNYLDHKSKKNKQDRNQYRKKDHHEAIVSRDDFIAVQHIINNAKYGHKGILPKLHVIPSGVLKGYVSINPRWAAFKVEDYLAASDSVSDDSVKSDSENIEVTANNGDFDLRGFEIARSQFFDTARKTTTTLSHDYFQFNIECIKKFEKTLYVEIFVHPVKRILAIRTSKKNVRNAVKWATIGETQYYPRRIKCAAYMDTLYDVFGWTKGCKYRVEGIFKQENEDKVLFFDTNDSEMLIPQTVLESDDMDSTKEELLSPDVSLFTAGSKKHIRAYPSDWAENFGSNVYYDSLEEDISENIEDGSLHINDKSKPFKDTHNLNVTPKSDIDKNIKEIICDMKREGISNGE